jgi:predicted nuclease with RNAse H fold
MRTLGIDLASADERTAGCLVEWGPNAGLVEALVQPLDDATIGELGRDVDVVAIDAPFGWPTAFVDAVTMHAGGGAWSAASTMDLRFRATDLHVQRVTGLWPLSVSSERIGVVAFRASRLLSTLRPADRAKDGSNGVLEVYPAAALARWRLPHRGYKRPGNVAERSAILDGLLRLVRLDLAAGVADDLVLSSDRLDALVSAIVARAYLLGETDPIPETERAVARVEGWIHLPVARTAEQHFPIGTRR